MNKFFQRTFNLDAGGGGGAGAGDQGGGQGGGQGAGGQSQAAAQGGAQPNGQQAAAPAQGSLAEQLAARVQQGQQPGDGQQQGGPYIPETLPQELRGANERETLDKVAKHLAEMPKAPASAKDYKFEPSPQFSERYGDLKDDPALQIFKGLAHKHGLDQPRFNAMIQDVYTEFEKSGILDGPLDTQAEIAKLAQGTSDPAEAHRKAFQRVNGIEQFVRGLETRKVINKQEATLLASMYASADATIAFEKVLALIPKEVGPQGGNGTGAGVYSWTEADRDVTDERYSTTSPKYDVAFRRGVDDKMRQLPPRNKAKIYS